METKRKCIEPGMLTYDTPPQVIPSRIDKEGCYVLSNAEMQRLKEVIAPYLQRKDECKPIRLEDLDEWWRGYMLKEEKE